MTPGQAEAARGRLEAFINGLLEASISALTDAERTAFDGGTGLDATPVPLFSRGPSKRTGLSASDPDGGWYVREGDHRDREDDKGKPLRKIAWALEATIATTARPPGAPPACPNLAIGLALARPGEDPGGTGARVLASAAARWSTPSLVETRFSPDALVWVTVVFHGTAAWRNHGLIIFPLLFYRTSVQLRCPAARLMAGSARQASPRGLGISSSGTPHCAAGSPGWSRVTLQRHRLRRRRRP